MIDVVEQTESEKQRQVFSRLCHDAGVLQFQIDRMKGDLAALNVKIHNANLDYMKAKEAETPAHSLEATEPKGVTQ